MPVPPTLRKIDFEFRYKPDLAFYSKMDDVANQFIGALQQNSVLKENRVG